MKLVGKDKIEFNINHMHDISTKMQTMLRIGSCQFIIDASNELKL